MPVVTLLHGDCLALLPTLPAQSVDLVLADLPYGTTDCKWDSVIPLDKLWEQYKRVLKPRGAVVLTAQQPFATDLINSNRKRFRYEWIWHKTCSRGFLNANRMPLRSHENVLVFYARLPTYNPQKAPTEKPRPMRRRLAAPSATGVYQGVLPLSDKAVRSEQYPTSVFQIANNHGHQPLFGRDWDNQAEEKTKHPTQKPVALMAYLIRTYSNPGDTVLDNTMGSGTTGVAAVQEGRAFIGMEQDAGYYAIAQARIAAVDPLWREGAA
jgi:site-specific DNA-methyltransferase (adenine-specific)